VTAGPLLSSLEDEPEAAAKQPHDKDEAASNHQKPADTTYKPHVRPLRPLHRRRGGQQSGAPRCVWDAQVAVKVKILGADVNTMGFLSSILFLSKLYIIHNSGYSCYTCLNILVTNAMSERDQGSASKGRLTHHLKFGFWRALTEPLR